MDTVRTCRSGQQPDGRQAADPGTILAAMSGWSGLAKDRLHGSLSEVIPEKGGQLTAGRMMAIRSPSPPRARRLRHPPAPGPADTAAVLPFRKPGQPAQPGRR
jgi:hypothetical protein